MTVQELIRAKYSGELSNSMEFIELIIQVAIVLMVGLGTWRLMVVFSKRKAASRKKSTYFNTRYSDEWKKK